MNRSNDPKRLLRALLVAVACEALLVAWAVGAEAPPAEGAGGGVAVATATSASARPPGVEGSIAFANQRGGIYDWQGDGEKGIWVRGIDRQWYYGKFMADCIGLPWANGVEFRTEPDGSFDKFSSIVVRHEHSGPCYLTSFVTSAGPPSGKARKAAAAAAAAAAAKQAGSAPPPR